MSQFDRCAESHFGPNLLHLFGSVGVTIKPFRGHDITLGAVIRHGNENEILEDEYGNVSTRESLSLEIDTRDIAPELLPLTNRDRIQLAEYPGDWIVDETRTTYSRGLSQIRIVRKPLRRRHELRRDA